MGEFNWGDEQISYMLKLLKAIVEDIEELKEDLKILRQDIEDLDNRTWSMRFEEH